MAQSKDETLPEASTGGFSAELVPGQIIGRYRLEEKLGTGGMGVVFRAADTQLGRPVALKFIAPSLVGDDKALERFLREARAASALDHPNVVAVYEVGAHGGLPFIAMALHQGDSLKQRIASGPIGAAECARILGQVADALAAAHQRKIVHRDVKPGNIILTTDGQVKLVDFGVAKLLGEGEQQLTRSGEIVGTLLYMAPEQHQGGAIGPAADLWAVGAVGYEMLSGNPPFGASSSGGLVQAVLHDDPPPLACDRALETILLQCLRKEPERRYRSAEALARDLRRFLAGETISVRRSTLGDRLRRRARRNRPTLVAAALGIAGMLALSGWLIQSRLQSAARAREARELGQRVQQIRGEMRAAHLLPIHDTKLERDRVRAQLSQLEAELVTRAPEARGPYQLALGLGLFSLGEEKSSRSHLEAAWQAGERAPELAYALGLELGTEYLRALRKSPPLEESARQAREQRLKETLRDPALAYLRGAGGAPDLSPDYVEGLVSLYEQRYDEALAHADKARREAPSLYEAQLLVAQTRAIEGRIRWREGKLVEARPLLLKADDAFKQLLEIARSDDRMYQSYAEWLADEARLFTQQPDADEDGARQRAIEVCELGRRANSEADWVDADLGQNLSAWANSDYWRSRKPAPRIEAAIAAAQRAVDKNPQYAGSWVALGTASAAQGDYVDKPGGADPLPSWRRSVEAYQKAAALEPDPNTYKDLGVSWASIARWQIQHGEDASAATESSVGAQEAALRSDPTADYTHHNMCASLQELAVDYIDRGRDPSALLDRAQPHCEAACQADRSDADSIGALAFSDLLRARWLWYSGGDPLPPLERGLAVAEHAAALPNPYSWTHENLSKFYLLRATIATQRNQDARAFVDKAEAAAVKANQIDHETLSTTLARAQLADVRERRRAGGDFWPPLNAAVALGREALHAAEHDLTVQIIAAEVELVRAEARPSPVDLEAARVEVERVLGANPRHARALAIRGRLEELRGDHAQAEVTRQSALKEDPPLKIDPIIAEAPFGKR